MEYKGGVAPLLKKQADWAPRHHPKRWTSQNPPGGSFLSLERDDFIRKLQQRLFKISFASNPLLLKLDLQNTFYSLWIKNYFTRTSFIMYNKVQRYLKLQLFVCLHYQPRSLHSQHAFNYKVQIHRLLWRFCRSVPLISCELWNRLPCLISVHQETKIWDVCIILANGFFSFL